MIFSSWSIRIYPALRVRTKLRHVLVINRMLSFVGNIVMVLGVNGPLVHVIMLKLAQNSFSEPIFPLVICFLLIWKSQFIFDSWESICISTSRLFYFPHTSKISVSIMLVYYMGRMKVPLISWNLWTSKKLELRVSQEASPVACRLGCINNQHILLPTFIYSLKKSQLQLIWKESH